MIYSTLVALILVVFYGYMYKKLRKEGIDVEGSIIFSLLIVFVIAVISIILSSVMV